MKPTLIVILATICVSIVSDAQELYPWFTYDKPADTLIWNKTWEHLEDEKFSDALKALNKLGKPYREDAAVHWLKALSYQLLNKDDLAFRHIGLAMVYAPECYGLLAFRAELWRRQLNYKNEAADLAAYLIHDPEDAYSAERYVAALEKINQIPLAIAFLEQRRVEDVDILNDLARLYVAVSRYDSAISILHRAIELSPTSEMSYISLAICYQRTGKADRALYTADRALAINPKSGKALAVKSWVYGAIDFDEESERYYYLAAENGYVWDE